MFENITKVVETSSQVLQVYIHPNNANNKEKVHSHDSHKKFTWRNGNV